MKFKSRVKRKQPQKYGFLTEKNGCGDYFNFYGMYLQNIFRIQPVFNIFSNSHFDLKSIQAHRAVGKDPLGIFIYYLLFILLFYLFILFIK